MTHGDNVCVSVCFCCMTEDVLKVLCVCVLLMDAACVCEYIYWCCQRDIVSLNFSEMTEKVPGCTDSVQERERERVCVSVSCECDNSDTGNQCSTELLLRAPTGIEFSCQLVNSLRAA